MRGVQQKSMGSTVVALSMVLALTGCSSETGRRTSTSPTTTDPPTGPLEAAVETCGAGRLADDGQTLIIDTKGEEDGVGDSIDDLVCLLIALETPTSVIEHMDSTRALDGMQTNSWDEFEARWNYHPRSGMGLTITLAD